ncbi:MAG: ribonuclease HII [Bdellovibrionales bacterium]
MKMNKIEKIDWKSFGNEGFSVIGVDEVGRGCLAGPVYAAAAVLRHSQWDQDLTDSKALSEKQRDSWALRIRSEHLVSLGFAGVQEIEELNILQATFLAMRRAIAGLGLSGGVVLVDGSMTIPQLEGFEQHAIVKGDLRVAPISAASIVAKVERDQVMKELGKEFPHYGFEVHKGYATAQHRKALETWGPCPWHRKTFGGVREYVAQPDAAFAPAGS